MMDSSENCDSLNHEAVEDLNMEIESAVGVSENVPEGITEAVDNVPGEGNQSNGVNLASANENGVNSSSVDENVSQAAEFVVNETRSHVDGESYASRAARTNGSPSPERPTWRRPVISARKDMPKRPRTALFTPSRSTTARSVFDSLRMASIDASDVQCTQRKRNGEVVVTFKSSDVKEKFLRMNAITVGSQSYAIQDIDRPLTFLTIYDAPFELSDWAIITRLAPFCKVVHYRRGSFDFMPGVYNGLRHYRVRIVKPIPSFLRFGKYQILLKHDGQLPTCRRCNLAGHFSNVCNMKICFNCEKLGHEACSCPAPALCNFCKEDGHLSRDCRYSWDPPCVRRTPADESATVNVEDRSDGEVSDTSAKSPTEDSFRWAEDSDLSDDDEDITNAEALPLAVALSSNSVEPSSAKPLATGTLAAEALAAESLSPVTDSSSADPPVAGPPAADPSAAEPATADSDPVAQPSFTEPPADLSPASPSASAAETPVLFESAESPPAAQPDQSAGTQSPSPDQQCESMLDSRGLIKPPVVVIDEPPVSSPASPGSPPATPSPVSSKGNRRGPAPLPRSTRCTPAVVLEALAAAAVRKATAPTLVSGRPRPPTSSATPMDTATILKRKVQTQTEAPPKEKRKKKKKKGRK